MSPLEQALTIAVPLLLMMLVGTAIRRRKEKRHDCSHARYHPQLSDGEFERLRDERVH